MTEDKEAATDGYMEEIIKLNNELVNLQRELSISNAELAKAVETKNRFVGMVVHDLRNPLTVITMYAETVKQYKEDPAMVGECSSIIQQSADFMAELIETLLDTTSIETGTFSVSPEQGDIRALAEKTIGRMTPLAHSRNIALSLSPGPGIVLYFDPMRIEQVLSNLVSNAIKYTPQGGSVEVSLSEQPNFALLTVRDTGMGIPEQEQQKIFSYFGRTSNKSPHGDKSVGLGLALCKTIVEAHGGSIKLTSAPLQGTTVTVRLPLSAENADRPD